MTRSPKSGAYAIGYRRPPERARFKKGKSGNPKGRPPGAKALSTVLAKALNEAVDVTENGRRKRISKMQAMTKQLVNKAASGDPRATQMLIGTIRTNELPSGKTPEEPFDDADLQVIENLLKRIRQEPGGGPDDSTNPT